MALEIDLDHAFKLRRDAFSGFDEWLAENPQTKDVFHMTPLNTELTLWSVKGWETNKDILGVARYTGQSYESLMETTPAKREWLKDGNR